MGAFERKPRPATPRPSTPTPTPQGPAKLPAAPALNPLATSAGAGSDPSPDAMRERHRYFEPIATAPGPVATIRRKPVVSSPDDGLEREADAVAGQVMEMTGPVPGGSGAPLVQPARGGAATPGVQPARTAAVRGDETLDGREAVRATERGGTPLPGDVRSFFEPRFGHDFGRVRLHTGPEAGEAARSVRARAYTVGDHVAFGPGEFAPGTAEGRKLLAHELAHVVQGSAAAPARIMRQQPAQQPVQQPAQAAATTVALTGSVGDGGANAPVDVRAVQDRLLALGVLSQADHTAEAVTAPTTPATTPAAPVVVTAIPRTMRAINLFALSAVGQPILLIVPGGRLHSALNATPVAATGSVAPAGTVGVGGANAVADVRAVQERLLATGYLPAPSHAAESAAIAALTGAVPDATIPLTLGALLHRLRDAGVTATQVAPASPALAALNAPPAFAAYAPSVGRVALTAAVGAGAANNVDDVRALQARLQELGYLSAAAATAERPGRRATSPVPDASLPQTIAAIARFQDEMLGPGVAVPANRMTPGTAGATALNTPVHRPPVALAAGAVTVTGTVGEGGANVPADVRAVQDRLLAIGLLTPADHAAEAVNVATALAPVAGIPLTIAAIQRFHRDVVGDSLAQIRAGHDVDLLNLPPRIRVARFELGGSVGTGGANAAADVRTVQERLHDLGYLSDAGFAAEGANPLAAAAVGAAAMPLTVAALTSFQTTVGLGRLTANGLVAPGDTTHRLLIDPRLPAPTTATFAASVGTGGANAPADVLFVQSRLRELGFLTTAAFLAERPAAGATAAVPDASLVQTIAAIDAFVQRAQGVASTGRLNPGGMAARALADPTFGTLTTINPNAMNAAAGPTPGTFPREVRQILTAVETVEAGQGGRGERPAEMQNAAGTPASWGKGQLIGGTAVGTLRANPTAAAVYGLDAAALNSLNDIAVHTIQNYDAIFAMVPAGGMTDAALQAAITAFIATDGPRVHRETGLFDIDITRMFRIAQLRRHMAAVRGGLPPGPRPGQSQAARAQATAARAAAAGPVATTLMNAATNPDSAANIQALGFTHSTVAHYLAIQDHEGENRQGFVTRALFNSQHGQRLRNAMTDNSGIAIGRMLVADNFAAVNRRAAALGVALTVQERAEVTARSHNSGTGGLDGFITNLAGTHADGYVVRFLRVWVP